MNFSPSGKIGAQVRQYGRDFSARPVSSSAWRFAGGRELADLPAPAMRGAHQLKNAATAVAALDALPGALWPGGGGIRRGLQAAVLPGRAQVLPGLPTVVLDVAHNAESAARLERLLFEMGFFPKTTAVVGMFARKDAGAFVRTLAKRVDKWIAVCPADGDLPAEKMAEAIRQNGGEAECADSVAAAVAKARAESGEKDRIVVAGSFWLSPTFWRRRVPATATDNSAMTRASPLSPDRVVSGLAGVCGEALSAEDAGPRHLCDWHGLTRRTALAVARPHSAEEVSAIVKWCGQHKIPIVPQGGNTGFRAGALPQPDGNAVVLSMEKIRAVREIHPEGRFAAVEAGCVLQNFHQAADAAGMFFPLSLGAKGTCQIGGNLSTNAGGLNALRYGVARDLCLGVEAVLPNGEIMRGLSALRKDNTGYDMRHLLIGAEGTLGIVTAASLKLFPKAKARVAAFAALEGPAAALRLLGEFRRQTGEAAESFELMPRALFELLAQHFPQIRLPFSSPPPVAALVEIAAHTEDDAARLREKMEGVLAGAVEDGTALDAVVAASESQRAQFWEARESAPLAKAKEGEWLRMDSSVPPHRLAEYIIALKNRLERICAGPHIVAYGHAGDGNMHVSSRPRGESPSAHPELSAKIAEAMDEETIKAGGSFSAEHGIGQTHPAKLAARKDPAALAMMKKIKRALDPDNLMNPGKIFPQE